MKTKTTLIAIFGAVLLAIGVTTVVLVNLDDTPQTEQQQTHQPTEIEKNEQVEVVSFTAEPDKTVLDQLASHAAIETKESTYGTYVDSINGKKGGEGGKYWTFYVDGQMAQVGAGAYVTEGGEKIEWKFE